MLLIVVLKDMLDKKSLQFHNMCYIIEKIYQKGDYHEKDTTRNHVEIT